MPLECVAITCAAQNHVVRSNFDRCIAVPAVSEGLPPTIEAFHQARTALQGHNASPAARRTNKPVRPASRTKKRSAVRLVGKLLLELRQRTSAPHRSEPRTDAHLKRAQLHTLHIGEPESTG